MLIDAHPIAGYREPYGLLAAILQDGTNEWRWELDPNLSEDAIVWQPYPQSHSIGGAILHIISVEVFWFEEFVLQLPQDAEEKKLLLADVTDVDTGQWPEPHRKPLSWYFELHDRVRARSLEGFKNWPEPEFSRDLGGHPRTMRWVFGHVIQHESYHGGQAVMLQELWKKRQ
ncbi:MAG: DinB family protein [bacterium]